MANSNFTVFSSNDIGSPQLDGTSGSLINVLDGCLVNGYGTKVPLGWTKPIANSGNTGCWKQPSGSLMTLFVNDSGPTGSAAAGTREAWATGWESLSSLTGSLSGTGVGQFPTTLQMSVGIGGLAGFVIPSGSVVWRKSITADNTPRYWILYGDASTFYLFFINGDTAGTYTGAYSGCFFGDLYSFSQTPDNYKCIISGRVVLNQAGGTGGRYDPCENLTVGLTDQTWPTFVARSLTNSGGSSTILGRLGDSSKCVSSLIATPGGGAGPGLYSFSGTLTCPNPADNSLYMAPITMCDTTNSSLRGRMRGMYHLAHPAVNFSDGQIIAGSNEYAGKTFQLVKKGPNGGIWAIEISPTVETN